MKSLHSIYLLVTFILCTSSGAQEGLFQIEPLGSAEPDTLVCEEIGDLGCCDHPESNECSDFSSEDLQGCCETGGTSTTGGGSTSGSSSGSTSGSSSGLTSVGVTTGSTGGTSSSGSTSGSTSGGNTTGVGTTGGETSGGSTSGGTSSGGGNGYSVQACDGYQVSGLKLEITNPKAGVVSGDKLFEAKIDTCFCVKQDGAPGCGSCDFQSGDRLAACNQKYADAALKLQSYQKGTFDAFDPGAGKIFSETIDQVFPFSSRVTFYKKTIQTSKYQDRVYSIRAHVTSSQASNLPMTSAAIDYDFKNGNTGGGSTTGGTTTGGSGNDLVCEDPNPIPGAHAYTPLEPAQIPQDQRFCFQTDLTFEGESPIQKEVCYNPKSFEFFSRECESFMDSRVAPQDHACLAFAKPFLDLNELPALRFPQSYDWAMDSSGDICSLMGGKKRKVQFTWNSQEVNLSVCHFYKIEFNQNNTFTTKESFLGTDEQYGQLYKKWLDEKLIPTIPYEESFLIATEDDMEACCNPEQGLVSPQEICPRSYKEKKCYLVIKRSDVQSGHFKDYEKYHSCELIYEEDLRASTGTDHPGRLPGNGSLKWVLLFDTSEPSQVNPDYSDLVSANTSGATIHDRYGAIWWGCENVGGVGPTDEGKKPIGSSDYFRTVSCDARPEYNRIYRSSPFDMHPPLNCELVKTDPNGDSVSLMKPFCLNSCLNDCRKEGEVCSFDYEGDGDGCGSCVNRCYLNFGSDSWRSPFK